MTPPMPMLQPIRAELAHNSKPAAYKTQIAKSPDSCLGFGVVAERTGLEPATPCVTGRYSNQLNYRSAFLVAPGDNSSSRAY